MTPFSYKGKRAFNTPEGQVEAETQEGFFLEEVVDFALGKLPSEEKEQLVVRLKNQEDKDSIREIPIVKNNKVTGYEARVLRRNENSSHVIDDQEAIAKWKQIFN